MTMERAESNEAFQPMLRCESKRGAGEDGKYQVDFWHTGTLDGRGTGDEAGSLREGSSENIFCILEQSL